MDAAKTAIVLARLSAGPLRDAYLDAEHRGWTPLMQYVRDGDQDAVARAIAEGADLDAIAEGADTALSLACTSGADAIVAMLLAAGADPRARARHDLTVLHLAAAHSSLDVTRQLIDAGARVEAAGSLTPLAVAIECDRIEILAYLVTQKLPVFEPSEAFSTACECGRLDAMQLLWERFGTEVWPRRSPTALMHAARGGNPRAVHFLIDLGAEVDDFDLKEDLSPLMHAVSNGRYDAAKALLERGADANQMTEWFVTAMAIAERRADGPMIELLRAHGAESTTNAELVLVAMPYATYSSAVPHKSSRSLLEDALATDDVRALAQLPPKDLSGALCAAVGADAPHCVAFLLASGADPHTGNPSALACAVGASDARAVRLMLAACPVTLEPTIAYAAASQSDPWILRDVLEHGAAVDTPVCSTRPIERAVLAGRWAHLALLLAHGALTDDDLNGRSPLTWAAELGNTRCVTMLLDHDSTGGLQIIDTLLINRSRLKGIRRIDMALYLTKDPRVIELLVRRGADPELVARLRPMPPG